MSVCIHPECQKTPLGMVGMCVYTILLIKKHTNPPPWPINLNLCSLSWLRVTARLPSWPPCTPASFVA